MFDGFPYGNATSFIFNLILVCKEKFQMKLASILLGVVGFSTSAFAAGGGLPHFPNLYLNLIESLGLSHDMVPVAGGLFILLTLVFVGLRYQKYAEATLAGEVAPTGKFSLSELTEVIIEFVYNLSNDLLGKKSKSVMPLLAGLFFFILFTNLSGLFPFLPPASSDFSANLAMGLTVFLIYNIMGFKEHGIVSYIKHFSGPSIKIPVLGLLLPILIFCIEMISHGFRPVSLSLRLMGNIFGDHMLVSVFTGMVYLFVPSILMFFGVLVAMVQSFVFTLLSAIYISMAVSHDH